MIEDNNLKVLQICSILHKIRQSEIKYTRAQYRVSYYRKIKKAILDKEPSVFLSNKNLKWKNNLKELNKKIEQSRLTALKAQKEMNAVKKKLNKPLNRLVSETNSFLIFQNGRVLGLNVGMKMSNKSIIQEPQFADKAAEYEANIAINKVLSK